MLDWSVTTPTLTAPPAVCACARPVNVIARAKPRPAAECRIVHPLILIERRSRCTASLTAPLADRKLAQFSGLVACGLPALIVWIGCPPLQQTGIGNEYRRSFSTGASRRRPPWPRGQIRHAVFLRVLRLARLDVLHVRPFRNAY